MNASDLRKLSVEELQKELLELWRAQFKLRLQRANEQLKQHHRFKSTRRDIARIQTVLNEKARQS